MHHDLELSHECFQVRNVGCQLHHLHSNHCLFLPGLDPKRVSLHHLASGRVNIREETRLVRATEQLIPTFPKAPAPSCFPRINRSLGNSNSLCVQFITNYSLSAYYLLYGRRSVCSSTGSAWGDLVWGAVWGVLYLVYAFDVSLLKESELGSSQLSNLEAGWSAIQLVPTFFLSPRM